jgi:hypothetical protein
MKLEFSRQIFEIKIIQVHNFTKIRPLGAELFHAGGRTDILKLIVAFPDFANVPEKETAVFCHHIVTVYLICLCVCWH